MKNIYFKVVAITTCMFLSLAIGFMSLVSFFASKKMGDVYAELGMSKLSLECYNKEYNNSNNINDLFFMFNLSVKNKDAQKTLFYIKKMKQHANYYDFLYYLNTQNENNIYVYNEERYIVSEEVNAYICLNAKKNAKNILTARINFYLGLPININEKIVLPLRECVNAGLAFSESEVTDLITIYIKLKDYAVTISGNMQKVAYLRLCEIAEGLLKLTNDAKYTLDILNFKGKI